MNSIIGVNRNEQLSDTSNNCFIINTTLHTKHVLNNSATCQLNISYEKLLCLLMPAASWFLFLVFNYRAAVLQHEQTRESSLPWHYLLHSITKPCVPIFTPTPRVSIFEGFAYLTFCLSGANFLLMTKNK